MMSLQTKSAFQIIALPKGSRIERLLFFVIAILSAYSCLAMDSDPDGAVATNREAESVAFTAAVDSINEEGLLEWIGELADDRYEGRKAGAPGGHAAAQYIVDLADEWGCFSPAGDEETYFQNLPNEMRNVLVLLEGTDPDLKNEYLIFSGHYDHVGSVSEQRAVDGDTICNGADDNASGCGAILEVMQAYAETGLRPRRSILFAFWDGEELGLIGSRAFAKTPTIPLDQVITVINIDMLGNVRDNRLMVYGTRTAAGLRQLHVEANEESALELQFPWSIIPNSDHWAFSKEPIPLLLYHSGITSTYHRPTDETDTLNFEGAEDACRMIFRTAHALADREEIPPYREEGKKESNRTWQEVMTEARKRDLKIGVTCVAVSELELAAEDNPWSQIPDADEQSNQAVQVLAVSSDSPAASAGLQVHDRIIEVNGQTIETARDCMNAVQNSGENLSLVVARLGLAEGLELALTLEGADLPLGLLLRQDDAEPGVLIVARVLAESPGEVAGVEMDDRIYEVNGAPCNSLEAWTALTADAASTVELEIERSGVVQVLELAP
jgi:hypothetical protein